MRGHRPPGIVRALVVLGAVAAAAVPATAQNLETAVRESYPTNLTLLTEATKSAVNELFIGFHPDPGKTILVESAGQHEANWFVENQLLAYLSDGGFQAYLKEAPMGPEPSQESAAPDSAGAPVEPMTSPPATANGDAGTPPDLVLRFRVVDFEITYPHNYRKSPLGSRHVQRRASVSLVAQLLKGSREDVVWVGNGDVERLDVVPAGKLPLLEGTNFPFAKPELDTRKIGSLVEPALVTGIVAGLIYLFYTNQN